jgi:hypothetical protein
MAIQGTKMLELFLKYITRKWPVASMSEQMILQVARLDETFLRDMASEWPLTSMSA